MDLTERGATGTSIFGGFLRDAGEYNPQLEGLSAFATYEKMRRSDAQVAATLLGMKLPIRSAEWAVTAPEHATPVEEEAAELVRECLLEELELDAVIDNALLMLDFGCAAHEDVYYVDGNRIRLKKLAPRLPSTFHRWITQGEDLVALEQYAYAGDRFISATIPAEKMALFTWQREGANYAGRSVMRAMYQHWYIKSNLYKIDAIAQERNGMGVPWIRMGGTVKEADKRLALNWLESLTAHEQTGLLLPPEWDFGLKGVEGVVRDPKESIAHHNVAISMAGLAQFMMLGQSDSGNRALGETMSDFFYLALQATANKIARTINWSTVRRLVDFNFPGIDRYPLLVPQQILSLRFESVVAALKDLANAGVNAVQPDDDLEDWVRSKMGAPKAGEARARPAGPAPKETEDGLKGSERLAHRRSRSEHLCEHEYLYCREPRGPELHLALDEMAGILDSGRDGVAAALRAARPAVQAEIVNKVVNAPVRTMYRVSVPPDQKLVDQVELLLWQVADGGLQQVMFERARQRGGKEPGDAATVRAAVKKVRSPWGVYADAVVAEFINTLTQRAVNVALDWIRRPGDLTKGEIIRTVEDELDEQSDKWIDGAAAKGANEAFADGRQTGYELYAGEIGEVQYSALLDGNTCMACQAADGESGLTPESITAVPNPDCEGGDKCRCVHVYVFADEVRN